MMPTIEHFDFLRDGQNSFNYQRLPDKNCSGLNNKAVMSRQDVFLFIPMCDLAFAIT